MNKNLVLIIGASSDIGVGLIKEIGQNSLILAHCNKSKADLLNLSREIDSEMEIFKADLSVEKEVISMMDDIENRYGVPNAIVHLAAPKVENIRFNDICWDDFERNIEIGLKSAVLIFNRFLPAMSKRKHGKIVLMLSSYTLCVPPKALSHYIVSKYALLGLMKSLASEYSDKNIQINSVSPSMVNTKFLSNINEKLVELNAYNHPLKRNASVRDVVQIIQVLISSQSDYLNGVNIPITGGNVF